ncbi:MAG: SURF1 family cytochrome oxidase biogenesis protein [Terricaulis sp.]
MIRFRPLLLLSVLSIAALVVLVSLGRWQWSRYVCKRAAANEPPVEITIVDYQPMTEGLQFVHDIRGDTHEEGWRVFAPVRTGAVSIFIDSDFFPGLRAPLPSEVRFPAALRSGAPVSGVSVSPNAPGRCGGRGAGVGGLLVPPPQPLERKWYQVDLAAMGRNSGLGEVSDSYVAAAYLGADGRATPNPFGGAQPAARHLGYAITWYGLAIVLLVVYFSYHVSVGRLSLTPPRPPED